MSSFTLLVAAIVVLDPTYWKLATRHLKLPFRIAIPAPHREVREELNTFFKVSGTSWIPGTSNYRFEYWNRFLAPF